MYTLLLVFSLGTSITSQSIDIHGSARCVKEAKVIEAQFKKYNAVAFCVKAGR